jgi:hypothetical protein
MTFYHEETASDLPGDGVDIKYGFELSWTLVCHAKPQLCQPKNKNQE